MAEEKRTGILTETGTNEFEIVEFTVGKSRYGINVAKVREVIKPVVVTKLPGTATCMEGIIELRGKIIPLVNLGVRLADEDFLTQEKHIIVCEFNQIYISFLVNAVVRIHRISWERMEPVPESADAQIATGVIKMEEDLIILLDFEKIIADISPEIYQKLKHAPEKNEEIIQKRSSKKIIIVEDSRMLRELIYTTLQNAGYKNIIAYENGKEAWEALENISKRPEAVEEYLNMIITDIEMPQMDGHHLLKKIKENDKLRKLPVGIFSSLINEEMRHKGETLGAIFQVAKPEIAILIEAIDKYIL